MNLGVQSCRSCDAAIFWAKTPKGKSMPIDAEPVSDGNLIVQDRICFAFDPMHHEGLQRYKSHFATCPQGPKWRKGSPNK